MRQRGQTTTFQTRLEISEHAEARVECYPHRKGSRVLHLDRTQVATAMAQARTHRLKLTYGTSGHWAGSRTFPNQLQEAILHLRTLHPGL